MSSLEHHLTELYVFIDDFLRSHPALAHWRQSPHNQPAFADAEVLTIALLQGCLGVASCKQTYRLVAHNYRSAFPSLCSYQQWMARLQALTAPISALLSATMQLPSGSAAFYLIDAKPLPVCHPLRHGRVRLLREDGAYWGKTSQGWFFGFKLHVLRHIEGRIVNLVLTPGNWDDRAPVLALLDGVEGGHYVGRSRLPGETAGGGMGRRSGDVCAHASRGTGEEELTGAGAASHRDLVFPALV
jgi:DDE family transposase